MESCEKSKKRKASNQVIDTSKWNFEVDYNDHFETPKQAYVDLLPVLRTLAENLGKAMEDLVIYDPYFCDGRVVEILNSLGFRNVINRNRDFYADISSHSIPVHDIMITNPPYSGDHKQKLLQYIETATIPYALLLPAYTATKSYWKEFIDRQDAKWATSLSNVQQIVDTISACGGSAQAVNSTASAQGGYDRLNGKKKEKRKADKTGHAATPASAVSVTPATRPSAYATACSNAAGHGNGQFPSSVLYVLPPHSYQYDHPEGTGKDMPPFYSAWFVGGAFSALHRVRLALVRGGTSVTGSLTSSCVTVVTRVEALIKRGYVTDSSKRSNPRMRKKKHQKRDEKEKQYRFEKNRTEAAASNSNDLWASTEEKDVGSLEDFLVNELDEKIRFLSVSH